MLTVNASNIDKDWSWVTEQGRGAAQWKNVSAETGLLAVQGPKAEGLVQRLADRDVTSIHYYHFAQGAVAGGEAPISRTGLPGAAGHGPSGLASPDEAFAVEEHGRTDRAAGGLCCAAE